MQRCNLLCVGSCRPKLGVYCSASQMSMSLKHVLLLVQLGLFNTRLALLLLLLLLLQPYTYALLLVPASDPVILGC